MMKNIILILGIITYINGYSQISYLDFTGLSNSNSITSITIGATGYTFDANITRTGTPSDPTVTNNGNFMFRMNSGTSQQCLNLTFSTGAQVYITDNNSSSKVLNTKDSLTINNSSYTLVDPSNNINMVNSGGVSSMTPNSGITSYTTWSITYSNMTSIQICGQRINPNGGTANNFLPIRIGVVTATLPIELINFDVNLIDNNSVVLNWQTATEVNNDYFTIECSQNGFDWTEIKTIEGAGNSSSLLDYTTTDLNPYQGISYYRLKQTDFDGEFSYSNVKSVNIQIRSINQIEIYPNPSSNIINIIGNPKELKLINVYNVLGENVTSQVKLTEDNIEKITLHLSKLDTGTYYIITKTTANKVYKQ